MSGCGWTVELINGAENEEEDFFGDSLWCLGFRA